MSLLWSTRPAKFEGRSRKSESRSTRPQPSEGRNFGKGAAEASGKRSLMFRAKAPYGLMCCHLSGESARRSTGVKRPRHSGSADGTKLKANASKHQAMSYGRMIEKQ